MAYSVVWPPNVLDDVDEIAAYIACDSPTYATVVVEKILDIIQNLQNFPLLVYLLISDGWMIFDNSGNKSHLITECIVNQQPIIYEQKTWNQIYKVVL
jgi:uncharacterized protein affecting Mg2+/Co2+ transport